jgi:hypothetical protein
MGNDIVKTPKGLAPAVPTQDAASRLKADMMAEALGRMFGKETEKPIAPGTPRVLLVLANHGHSPGWERAKVLQRQMFEAASGGLEMKFGSYGADDDKGVRRCRISKWWRTDPDDMAGHIDRATCDCGCFVNIRSMLEQAVEENKDRPMRAVVIVGDAFHDDEKSLAEAALAINQLRREGTRTFLIQEGDDPVTARMLQYLERISGAAYLSNPQRLAELLELVSVYAAGGEEAVKARGGQTATLLLEHFQQRPMPILEEEREPVQVNRHRR